MNSTGVRLFAHSARSERRRFGYLTCALGYESVAVTQKAYNWVAILSRHPMKTIAKALVGDDSDSHARFLEVVITGTRIVNIYAPNGNPVGSEKFAYKLAWMDRLTQQM